jgi:hypothetical protein
MFRKSDITNVDVSNMCGISKNLITIKRICSLVFRHFSIHLVTQFIARNIRHTHSDIQQCKILKNTFFDMPQKATDTRFSLRSRHHQRKKSIINDVIFYTDKLHTMKTTQYVSDI